VKSSIQMKKKKKKKVCQHWWWVRFVEVWKSWVSVGYYAASMNKWANVTIFGNAGTGVAENMMSGRVQVKAFCLGVPEPAHGGLLIIDGDASLRCGILSVQTL